MEMVKFSLKELVKISDLELRVKYYQDFHDLAKRKEMAQIPINLDAMCDAELQLLREDDVRGQRKVIEYHELRKKLRKIEVTYSYEYACFRDEEIIYNEYIDNEERARDIRVRYDSRYLDEYNIRLASVRATSVDEHNALIKMAQQVSIERREPFNIHDYKIQLRDGFNAFAQLSLPPAELALPIERGQSILDTREQHSDDLHIAVAEKNHIVGWLDNQTQHSMVLLEEENQIIMGKALSTPQMVWAFPETVPSGYNMVALFGGVMCVVTRDRYIYEEAGAGEILIGRLGAEDIDDSKFLMTTTMQLVDILRYKGKDYEEESYEVRQDLCESLRVRYPHMKGERMRFRNIIWIHPGKVTVMYKTCGFITNFAVYRKNSQLQYEIVKRPCVDQQLYVGIFGDAQHYLLKICKRSFEMTDFLSVLAEKVLWFRDKEQFKLAMEDLGYKDEDIESLWA